jgi:hypothetical protein
MEDNNNDIIAVTEVKGELEGTSEASIVPLDVVSTVFDTCIHQIQFALELDLERHPHLSQGGNEEIPIHSQKQANKSDRNRVLQVAYYWGYADTHLTRTSRRKIAKAACHLVAYDHGFVNTLAVTQVPQWEAKLHGTIVTDKNSIDCISPKHSGTSMYVSQIERKNPGDILELF